jgi:hypothetical protein
MDALVSANATGAERVMAAERDGRGRRRGHRRGETRERRRHRTHPAKKRPELLATAANQVARGTSPSWPGRTGQYTSIAFTERLAEAGIDPLVGARRLRAAGRRRCRR